MLSGKFQTFCLSLNVLTHSNLVMSNDIVDLGQHWFRFLAYRLFGTKPLTEPSNHMRIYHLRNTFQWNFIQNLDIFIQENAFENATWKWQPTLNALIDLDDFSNTMSPYGIYLATII